MEVRELSEWKDTAETWARGEPRDIIYPNKFVGVPDIIADWYATMGASRIRDVIDFGCGEATMALGFALRHGARRVVGIEPHEEMDKCLFNASAQVALEHLPDNLELVRVSRSPLSISSAASISLPAFPRR